MTSLNFSQKFAALDHLESVRIYITHGLAGRENQMPRPRISAGAAVFRMAIMAVSVFKHDDIAALVSQALVARQFLHFPHRARTHSNANRKSLGWGQSGFVSLKFGGRRKNKKKK